MPSSPDHMPRTELALPQKREHAPVYTSGGPPRHDSWQPRPPDIAAITPATAHCHSVDINTRETTNEIRWEVEYFMDSSKKAFLNCVTSPIARTTTSEGGGHNHPLHVLFCIEPSLEGSQISRATVPAASIALGRPCRVSPTGLSWGILPGVAALSPPFSHVAPAWRDPAIALIRRHL